jgi:heme/copper-type cytochrome/quinol oxidase subunit 1
MLPAKLFSALALIFLICAGLARLKPFSSVFVDLPLHGTYFVFGPMLVLLFCAVASANFAVLYYAAIRIFHARWNRILSILHFSLLVCFGISLAVVFAAPTHGGTGLDAGEALRWLVIPASLGILSLVACLVVFGANLTLVVVQIVRARFASH